MPLAMKYYKKCTCEKCETTFHDDEWVVISFLEKIMAHSFSLAFLSVTNWALITSERRIQKEI